MTTNMTYHAQYERFERISFIIDNIGLGEELYHENQKDNTIHILTSTGIVIIKNTINNKVITVYTSTIDQAYAIIKNTTGRRKIPDGLEKKIRANQKIMKKFK